MKQETLPISMYMLQNGETIISYEDISDDEGTLILASPALVIIKRSEHGPLGFMLYPFAPNELLKHTAIYLDATKIQSSMLPSTALVKFYANWVKEEEDKLKVFNELFEKQIGEVGKKYLERTKTMREQQQKTPLAADTALSDAMIELFEDSDAGWGDPSVTH